MNHQRNHQRYGRIQRLTILVVTGFCVLATVRNIATAASDDREQRQVERKSFEDRTRPIEFPSGDTAPRGRFVTRGLRANADVERTNAWGVTLSAGSGYDSNPDGTHAAVGSALGDFELMPSYTFELGDRKDTKQVHSLALSYDVEQVVYEDAFEDSNALDQKFEALYKRGIGDWTFSLDAKDTLSLSGGKLFLNRVDGVPKLTYSWKYLSFGGRYGYSHLDYLFTASTPAKNPDAERHEVAPNLVVSPRKIENAPAQLTSLLDAVELVYVHTWNDARGSDFEYEGNRLQAKLRGLGPSTLGPLCNEGVKCLSADVSYSSDWTDYKNPNSASATGSTRHDRIDKASILASYLLGWPKVNGHSSEPSEQTPSIFVRYDVTDQHSNIESKDYSEHVIVLGISATF